LRLLGVKFGKNLKTLPIAIIENPSEIKMGDDVWISRDVALYATNGIQIGNDVIIARDVSLISGDHAYSRSALIREQGMQKGGNPIVIGNDVWIGEKISNSKRSKNW